ncbi:MAG TPA: peptide ABC transporter substrate-binding protein [Opitutaceae bacterium]|jgi:oligopeptide transport system substrate-binding protein|nr:peptide ABC transporter substrate-binding protein [Opitutaceae bacterium]
MLLRLPTVTLGFLAIFLAAGCARRTTPAEDGIRTQTLLLGNGAEPRDLDPEICNAYTDYNILIALYEGLTCIDEKTSQAVPGVAESWEVSPDGLVYTFHLRASARWSNGDSVTADDFVYSFHRILSPGLASEYAYMLYFIKNAEAFNNGKISDFAQVGVQAPDAHTLRVALEHPCPFLPAVAAHQSWFPVHRPTIEKFGRMDQPGTRWTRPGNLVGNGPFMLKEWSQNARIVAVKNPFYWDAAHNHLDSVVFFPTDDIATDESNFRAGQIHLTYDLLPDRIEHYRREAPQFLRIDPFSETFFLRFNVTKPPLSDQRVRQALARAIDRVAITRNVLHDSRQPAYALTPPDTAGYTPNAKIPTDFDAARRLLAEAGYPGGKNFPILELQTKNDATWRAVLEAIQETWKRELGIHVQIASLEQKTWLANWQTLNYQMSSARWVGDYDDPTTFLYMFKSDSGNNETGWANARYDHLNDKADRAFDPAQRNAFMQEAEALLLDQAPIAPVYYGTRTYLIQPYVKGWVPSLLGIHRYQSIDLEK